MMKKIAKLMVLVLMLSTCLMACGKKEPAKETAQTEPAKQTEAEKTTEPATEDVDLDFAAVYDNLIKAQPANANATMFEESDPELIEGLYPGLADVKTAKFTLYAPPITGFACELCMVKVEDEKDIEAVKKIFQARIDAGAAGGQCDEDVAEIWKNHAQVQEYGTYVAMIALPNDCEIPENVFTLK